MNESTSGIKIADVDHIIAKYLWTFECFAFAR